MKPWFPASTPRIPSFRADLKAHGALLTVALLYGGNYFVAKGVFDFLSPAGAVAIRTGGSALLLILLGTGMGRLVKVPPRKDIYRLILCAFFGAILNQNLFFAGLARTTEVNASVIMTTSPIFVFLVAYLARAEVLNLPKIIGLIVSFSGALLLSVAGRTIDLEADTLVGDLLVVSNACSYAIYLVLVQPLMKRYDVITIMAWIFGLAALINVPFGVPAIMAADWAAMDWTVYGRLAYLVLGVTVLAYSLNAYALKRVPSSQVGVYIYLQPVIVSVLAAFLPNKHIGWMQMLCMMLVFVGVALVTYGKKTK
ncbi:MAG: DMT family transporter [Bacteroidia bacterium]|nr:DMT family transporter [Bacteroidia bacterium]